MLAIHPTEAPPLMTSDPWHSLFALPAAQRYDHRFHLVGIGGTGLGPIADVLLQLGFQISGSDQQENATTQRLSRQGARIHTGHDARHLLSATAPHLPDVVLRSSAIPDGNSEVIFAHEHNIPVVNRNAFLGPLTAQRRVIAVAGTHGKTTTTGMIAHILTQTGHDAGYIIGSDVPGLGAGHAGREATFVIEADEYDYAFLGLSPHTIVLTSLDWDHPDCFPTPADYQQAFQHFVQNLQAQGHLIACRDDADIRQMLQGSTFRFQVHWYGTHADPAWRIHNIDIGPEHTRYELQGPQGQSVPIQLQIPGLHNILNSSAALIAANLHGIDLAAAATALRSYVGASRRFEIKGTVNDIIIIDDYAHHPSEIRTTLNATRARYPDRDIWAVYQPHTYSRTKALLDQYAHAFTAADYLLVTDIYAAREAYDDSISAAQVAAVSRHPQARAAGDLAQVEEYLRQHVQPHSVIILLSAGSATLLGPRLLHSLQPDLP